MGRKKSSNVSKPAFRPFCYYCDRDFENEKVLIQHQKLKHFQCLYCHRKADTAPGLISHMLQVHKDAVLKVPNAVATRDDPDLTIHGMNGVPTALLNEKAKGTALEDQLRQKRIEEARTPPPPMGPVFPHMYPHLNPFGQPGPPLPPLGQGAYFPPMPPGFNVGQMNFPVPPPGMPSGMFNMFAFPPNPLPTTAQPAVGQSDTNRATATEAEEKTAEST